MKICRLTLSLVLAIAPFVQAQTSPSHNDDLADIAETLKRIEATLKRQTEIQQADVLLRRVTFAETQIATAQGNLKKAEDESRTLRNESNQIDAFLKNANDASDSAEQRTQATFAKNRMSAIQERLTALEQDRVTMQNDIEGLRRDLREWQTQLDKMLRATP